MEQVGARANSDITCGWRGSSTAPFFYAFCVPSPEAPLMALRIKISPKWLNQSGELEKGPLTVRLLLIRICFRSFSVFFLFFRFSVFPFFSLFFWMYNLPLVRPYWNVCGSATSALLRRVRTRRLDFLHQLRLGTSLEPFWNNLAVPFPPCYPVYFSLNYYYYYYFGYFPLCWYHLFLDMPIITITIGS